MDADPNTGERPYLHAAGDVLVFDSEEARDAYVAPGVVGTHLGGGRDRRDRKYHWVSKITATEGRDWQEKCASCHHCIHKDAVRLGQVRIHD